MGDQIEDRAETATDQAAKANVRDAWKQKGTNRGVEDDELYRDSEETADDPNPNAHPV